jgi:dsDNA-specific endonuclease/ATPase MutS2
MIINTPISVGELIDKVTILEIKQQRISNPDKLQHINNELQQLMVIINDCNLLTTEVHKLKEQLKTINETLWVIEDDIRACEKAKDFTETFVKLARSVYFTNDKRADVKRQINVLTNSDIHEVKSYEEYA